MRAIDADVLIDKYGDWYTEEGAEEGYIGTIKGIVDSMPTIEPERKTGKWEERGVSTEKAIDEWQSARCSVCGLYHTTPYLYYFNHYNYCPSCGARIEKNEM